MRLRLGLRPDTDRGAYIAPPDHLAAFMERRMGKGEWRGLGMTSEEVVQVCRLAYC